MQTTLVNPLDWKQINEMEEEDRVRHISWYNPEAFYKIRPENLTEKVCEAAAEAGINLDKIPIDFRTNQTCWNAVRRNPGNITHVPLHILSESLVLTVIQTFPKTHGGSCLYLLRNISDELISDRVIESLWHLRDFVFGLKLYRIDERFAKKLLKYNGTLLSHVKNPTRKECWIACKQTGRALEFVPATLQTPSICVYALGNQGSMKDVKIPIEDLQEYLIRVTGAPDKVFDCMSIVLGML